MIPASEHACDVPDLIHHYRPNGFLYRTTCQVCPRRWEMVKQGDRWYWNVVPYIPGSKKPGFQNRAAIPMEPIVIPQDEMDEQRAARERRRQIREAAEFEERRRRERIQWTERGYEIWQGQGGGKKWKWNGPAPVLPTKPKTRVWRPKQDSA